MGSLVRHGALAAALALVVLAGIRPGFAPTGARGMGPLPDASPVADLEPAVAGGLALALVGVLAVTVLVLRRGRSGVGL